ncbi:hypothetical protein [Gordonia sp. NPDC003376]
MNRGPVALHRFTTAVIGLLCLVVGLGAIAHETGIAPVTDWEDRLDASWATTAIDASWWWAVLLGLVVVGLVWGTLLIATVWRPGKADAVTIPSPTPGQITLPPKLIAASITESLSAKPMFGEASATAVDDRGRRLIRIEVTATPGHSYDEVAAALAPALRNVRRAVEGTDIGIQALVHLEQPTTTQTKR